MTPIHWLAMALCLATMILPVDVRAAVDVNTASAVELETVTGIGPAISDRIVQERRQGLFRDPSDLARRVKGIGERKLRRMVESGLVVGGNGGITILAGGASVGTFSPRVPVIAGQMNACQRVSKSTRPGR